MPLRILYAFVLFTILSPLAARAQTQGPSDNDLLAGYCLGVVQQMQSVAEGMKSDATHTECRQVASAAQCAQMAQSVWDEAERLTQRFIRYILARGYSPGGPMIRSVRGLDIMRQNGAEEHARCEAEASACVSSRCVSTARRRPEDALACLQGCRAASRACLRVDRCLREDVLPF